MPSSASVSFERSGAASVDFGTDDKPLYFNAWSMQESVRGARSCCFRRIALTMFAPPPPCDPPRVFFGANQARIIDRDLECVEEGLRIFRDENYRNFVLYGQAAPNEAPALRLARAAAVRDALIHRGVDPSLIVMEEERAPDADGPASSVDPAFYRCVTIDFED